MTGITRAERARLNAAVLYPEQEDALLTTRQVAELTGRDVKVIRHYVAKGILPATTNDRGEYLIRAAHIAVVLFQPAWGENQRVSRLKRHQGLKKTTRPGTTPEALIG